MKKKEVTCVNCEQKFDDRFKFCPHCGQKSNEDLTLSVLFYNTISNYFSVDARFFKSFLPLLLKPGYLAKKFIEGKRLLYLHPAQLYLFISVVFFFVFSFIERDSVQSLDKNIARTFNREALTDTITNNRLKDSINVIKLAKQKKQDSLGRIEIREALENNKFITGMTQKQIDSLVNAENFRDNGIVNFDFNESKIDSLIAIEAPDSIIYKQMGLPNDAGAFKRRLYRQALKFYKSKQGGSILQAFYDTIPIAMFFLLPIFAFILKLLYRKKGRYAYHLVFSFYYFAFLFTTFSIIICINFIFDIPDWIDWLVALSTFIYLVMSLKHFYEQGWFKTFIKANVSAFLFLSFVAPITIFILGMFAFLYY